MWHSTLWSCIVIILHLGFINSSPALTNYHAYQLRQAKASEMLQYMNRSFEACSNFYRFSSGNYRNYVQEFLDDQASYSAIFHTMHLSEEKSEKELENFNVGDTVMDTKVKRFYKSCVNRSKDLGFYRPKLKELVEEFGQMPALEGENWHENEFQWADVVAKINAKMDIGIILHARMSPDSFNNSINRATLLQPELTLPKRIHYEDSRFEKEHFNIKSQIYDNLQVFLNLDPNTALPITEEIFNFEIALAHGLEDLESERPDYLYNVTTLERVQSQYIRAWDTKKHFATALGIQPHQIKIQHTYLENLAKVISRTPKRQIANYIFYTYLNEYMKLLSSSMSCHELTAKHFNAYLQNMMYRKSTNAQDRNYLNFIWHELKSAFEDKLNSYKTKWLSNSTLLATKEKLQAMQLKFVSYEHINFARKYENLRINERDFMENLNAVLRLHGDEGRAKVWQAPHFLDPPTGMPAYAPEENIVYLPVAFLQTNTVWSIAYPYAINFGSIGSLLAHEMTHGFDDFGRYFDKKGNFHNWWDFQSAQNFEAHKACFVAQYSNYKFRGAYLPILQNQAENIADNVGLQLAYKAYTNWYSRSSITDQLNEMLTPVLVYNHKQLFFLSFGQMLGGAISDNFVYDNDAHVPSNLRLKGTVDNMLAFAEAFDCPAGSPMNPFRKCEMY